jgi:hopanoid biosynthesis associated RND transporter like protein HpnN
MRHTVFRFVAHLSCRWPGIVLVLAAAFSVAGALLASRLQTNTSRLDLLSPDNEQVRNYDRFTGEFGTANNVYFIIESDSLEKSKRCADALAAEISRHPRYIRDVFYQFDVEFIKHHLFVYLTPEQLGLFHRYLARNYASLTQLAAADNLNDVFATIAAMAETKTLQEFREPAAQVELAALSRLLESINSYVWEDRNDAVEFLPALVSGALPLAVSDDPDGYLVGKEGRMVFLLARPNAEREDNIEFLRPMMQSLLDARRKVLADFKGVTIGMTGLPTFAYGDLQVIENEIPYISLAALGLILLIFFLFFRHPGEIAFTGLAMLAAILCTLGITELLIGRLNILSSVFAVTLIGLSIDFGVHFISRYHDERKTAQTFDAAMQSALVGCGPPIATGALTTAAAFYLLAASDFLGLTELGLIAGTGIVLSLISMLTIVPALESLRKHWLPPRISQSVTESFLKQLITRFADAADRNARPIAALAAAGTLAMCFFAPQVAFDYNFLHIQPRASASGQYEEVLMERTGLAPAFNVIVKDDLRSIKHAAEQLTRLPTVSRVDSAEQLVPLDQDQCVEIARTIIPQLAQLREAVRPSHGNPDVKRLIQQYEEMQRGLETAIKTEAIIENEEVISEMNRSLQAVRVFLDKAQNARADISDRLHTFSEDLFTYVGTELTALTSERQLDRISFADLPENVRTRFVGRTGKYAAYVFPSQSVWNKAFLDRFNADVKSVAPDAAGAALFAQTLLDIAGNALRECSLLVLGAVVLLVFLDFRSVVPSLLALLSVTVGVIWMLGIMRLVGWSYNPINMMAVPLTLGIGIDNGVHIVHRFRDNGGDARAAVLTSGRAIAVSSLTTMAGFACLLLSTHRGLISLGQLLVLGVGACLISSLFIFPAILKTVTAP